MKIRLPQIMICIGIILLMTFLFIKTNVIESDTHNHLSQHLHHLKELDATLDKNILESRYGLINDYDTLINDIGELNSLQTKLKTIPAFFEFEEQQKIDKLLGEFQVIQEEKEHLIERFKSRNAIINNSLRYFPVATSNLIKNIPANSPLQKELEPLNFLLRDILTYYLLTGTELEPAILSHIELLQQYQKDESLIVSKTDLEIIISHSRTILRLKPEVDELVKQITSLPTAEKVEEIIEYYDKYYNDSLSDANTYRLLLYILSVLLLAYIGFIIIKLKKATAAVKAVNDNLEQRVQARTEELSWSNSELHKSEANNRVIFEIVQGISTTSNLKELLDHIYFSINKLLYAENYFVALYDATTESLDMQFFVDKYNTAPLSIKIGRNLASYVFQNGQPMLAALENIERLIKDGKIQMKGQLPALWLGVPLRTPSGVIGVLVVQHYEDGNAYNQKDLELLTSVGDQIATAIERKKTEEALRENEAKFRDLFDNAPVAYHELDTNGHFTRINHTEELMLGYTNEELIGRHPSEIIVEKVSREAIAAKLAGKMPLQAVERTFIRKDGSLISVLNEDRLIYDKKGKVTGIRSTLQDITERKSLEEKLQRQQKLESIGQLAAGIAHEINTPTQYVGDNVRFLKDGFEDFCAVWKKAGQLLDAVKANTVTAEFVAEMEEAIEEADMEYLVEEIPGSFAHALDGIGRISKIVQSMKDFAHPGSTEKKAADLNKAIESTITVASNEWRYVADIVTDYDKNLPLVPCLAGEFNQVILNMIVNAAHSISDVNDGGKGKISISTRHKGEWAEIRISDTGRGMSEEICKKIFDPFFTTKEVGKGTGQGLAISHTVIVEKHKGTIDVESEIGKGTTFVICLPVQEEPED